MRFHFFISPRVDPLLFLSVGGAAFLMNESKMPVSERLTSLLQWYYSKQDNRDTVQGPNA